jgi:catechol 2,3-dioxygenase-like lactoylglutathione lyase family enzyme
VAPPHLFRVILPVSDIEAAAAFYTRVLGIPGIRVSGGRHYFDCGGTILACYDPLADGDCEPVGVNPQYVYFAVDDLDAVRVRASEAGCRDGTEIEVQPWGERSFYAHDPFGNPICFVDSGTCFTGRAEPLRPDLA